MSEPRIPTVRDLRPMVEAAVRELGRASTSDIRDRVLSALQPEQRAARHGKGRSSEVGYRLRWAILDLTRHQRITRVAPRIYAPIASAEKPVTQTPGT